LTLPPPPPNPNPKHFPLLVFFQQQVVLDPLSAFVEGSLSLFFSPYLYSPFSSGKTIVEFDWVHDYYSVFICCFFPPPMAVHLEEGAVFFFSPGVDPPSHFFDPW